MNYASIWRRLIAALVDFVVIQLLFQPWRIMTGVIENNPPSPVLAILWLIITLLELVIPIYFLYLLATKGQTPGKMLLGIKVIREKDSRLSSIPIRVLIREILGKSFSAIPLFIGYLWMLRDPRKQTWHDKMAGTVVVKMK